MKIATYNIWNDINTIGIRTEQLIQEIIKVDADIIGLQEVPLDFWQELIKRVEYKYHVRHFVPSRGEDYGLAFLSKYPLTSIFFLHDSSEFHNSFALNITFNANGSNFSVANVHLPWDSVLARENQILAITDFINKQREGLDFSVLLGDFNCVDISSVHRFLLREQSLAGREAIWDDIAAEHAKFNGYTVAPTLDFATNPRWKNDPPEPGWVVDRIFINGEYGDYKLLDVSIFGTDISPDTGYAPSDHYGVLAEIDFRK